LFINLRPTLVQLLIESNSSLLQLLKLTFGDLLFRKVLIVRKRVVRLNPRDKYEREYTFVETGANFNSHRFNKYESYFTDLLDEDSYFILKSFLRTVYESVHSRFDYSVKVINSNGFKDYFNFNYFYYLISRIQQKSKAKELGVLLKNRLDQIDETINDDLLNNNKKAKSSLLELGSHIFLLKNIDFTLLEEFKQLNKSIPSDYFIIDDYIWTEFWDSDFIDVFDSVEYSLSSSGDYDPDFDFY